MSVGRDAQPRLARATRLLGATGAKEAPLRFLPAKVPVDGPAGAIRGNFLSILQARNCNLDRLCWDLLRPVPQLYTVLVSS
jgi:hypothetical protein